MVSNRAGTRHSLAALAVLGAAGAYSTGPLLVHLTATDINPFYFNLFVLMAQLIGCVLFLMLTKPRWVDEFFQQYGDGAENQSETSIWDRLTTPSLHLGYFESLPPPPPGANGTTNSSAKAD